MCKLSIIVPVYNTEAQLKKCLESIIPQITQDIELLIINDGSTDSSEEIIKQHITKYPGKITYYSKQNSGIADTRNFGIEHAKGTYILFVDSDDFINKELTKIVQIYIQKNIDLIKFKLQRVDENNNIIQKVNGPVFEQVTGQEAFNLLAFEDVLLDSPCVYIFKKNLFVYNNLKFKLNTEHEDFGLIPLIILKSNTAISINYYGYNYVQSNNSITRNSDYNKTKKKFIDALKHYDFMILFLEKQELTKNTKKNLKTYYTNAIILKLKELKNKDKKTYIKEIRKRKMIKNIQVNNVKQLIKKIILIINIKLYLKLK